MSINLILIDFFGYRAFEVAAIVYLDDLDDTKLRQVQDGSREVCGQ
ncbi:hypothetical protein [uncultured Neisseria sp.]|nr:hypothetical protein [uncultured Neisseria sp.]